ncbi:hypothetical protein C6N75_18220 [Streptomyces solincola]|uniref:Uncharacterized protein n=1 Tax=Streptomyces solincola TaxID=2100817 RepID=A0A2S9PTW2_9ACTN|nr:hypothetical protein C6N75_18220 [Streptomyces solincola]
MLDQADILLPAHAGMVPSTGRGCISARPAPRARGDGPAGAMGIVMEALCSPRTRGWGPATSPSCRHSQTCSLRTRGRLRPQAVGHGGGGPYHRGRISVGEAAGEAAAVRATVVCPPVGCRV